MFIITKAIHGGWSRYMDKKFLTIKEICEYTGWGETKVREIVKRKDSVFTVKMGNRYYVDKKKFDDYLDNYMKYQIEV